MALSPPGPFICSESEELDERPHVLFLTAARKALGSCQLGDTMEARPKQFRYNLWLRSLPLKQLQELGKRESQLRWSSRLIEWYAQAERKHHFIQCWRRRGELQIRGRDRFDRISTLNPFPCLLQNQAQLLETLDSNRGENSFAASKMTVQDGLTV